ncbi:CBS domain-containing protein [Archaeoglobus neptunius]|uniref:CBS domain-containing protein n=1 Tax=Archaeoglobus neptunius TaxID=2798580 RepID=UPI001928913E|nr:CBS domain-containing protein [Archaeoglobus neptunius]
MDVEELKELVREDYEMVDAGETVSKLFPLLEKLDRDKANAILVQEGGKVIGVVREKDLIRGSVLKNPHETKVKSLLVRTGKIDISDLDPAKVARRFVEDSTPFVIVQMGKKFGVIYINDFLRKLRPFFKGVKVREVMNPEVITVRRFDTAAKALSIMRNNGVDRVVIVDENNRVIGILTGKDVIDRVISPRKRARMGDLSGEKEKTLSIMVESIMSSPVLSVSRNDSVGDVIDLMVENRISSVVVTTDGIPDGIVLKKDILEEFLKRQEKKEFGIQIMTTGITLDEFDRKTIEEDVEKFMRKFSEFLGESYIFVYIKRHKEFFRNLPLIHVRLKLSSARGNFMVSGESWGVEYALHVALKKLEREVLKEKEILQDRRMEKKFYEEVFEY